MSKLWAIVADPILARRAGLRTLLEFAALVHVGRCGLQGATRKSTGEALGVAREAVVAGFLSLENKKMISEVGRSNTTGNEVFFVCTRRGWDLLTQPGDFTMFPQALNPMKIKI